MDDSMDANRPLMKGDQNSNVYDFEHAIQAAGGFGRFQVYSLIILLWSISGFSFYIFAMSYLELMPRLQWLSGGEFVKWDAKDIWDGSSVKPQDQWRIDWSDPESLHNWITDMGLYCSSSFEIGLFGSLFFFGFAVCGVLVKLLENYGRRPILIAGVASNIILSALVFFINNVYVLYTCLFLYGVSSAKILITYMYITEMGPERSGVYWCGVINWIEQVKLAAIAILPTSLYFMFISNEWKHVFVLALVTAVVVFPFIFYIPESPKFLYEKGRHYELRQIIKRIAKVNRVKLNENFVFENANTSRQIDEEVSNSCNKNQLVESNSISDTKANEERFSVAKYLTIPAVIVNLVVWWIIFMASNFNYSWEWENSKHLNAGFREDIIKGFKLTEF